MLKPQSLTCSEHFLTTATATEESQQFTSQHFKAKCLKMVINIVTFLIRSKEKNVLAHTIPPMQEAHGTEWAAGDICTSDQYPHLHSMASPDLVIWGCVYGVHTRDLEDEHWVKGKLDNFVCSTELWDPTCRCKTCQFQFLILYSTFCSKWQFSNKQIFMNMPLHCSINFS